jgi:hypothetical protein
LKSTFDVLRKSVNSTGKICGRKEGFTFGSQRLKTRFVLSARTRSVGFGTFGRRSGQGSNDPELMRELALDVLILATGYDAVTGSIAQINTRGTDGVLVGDTTVF